MPKHFAVIGDPVDHSLSPAIHHKLYEIYGINAVYHKLLIPRNQIPKQLMTLVKEYRLDGFNVTMPHKQAVIPFLAGISKEATIACSVNTVCCRQDGLHGYTTDAKGFCRAVAGGGRQTKGLPVVFLGAGGVCGALALHWGLQEQGPITIIARNPAKAQLLVDHLKQQGVSSLTLLEWTMENLEQAVKHTPLLVNTTPLGMAGCPDDFSDLSFLRRLPQDALVYDLIYQPRQTALLQAAKERGLQTANGIDMLIYQAMEAFTLFVGVPTKDQDKTAILHSLEQQGLV